MFFIARLRNLLVLILMICSVGQASQTAVGVRIQKTPNLYFENGLTFDYSSSDLWQNRIHFGATYASSRLGSALGSNALKQDNILVSSALHFRQGKQVEPILGLNIGYFMLDTENEIFSALPSSSLLLSLEFGAGFNVLGPVSIQITVGYNLITGNGVDGPGTLYPIFLNFSTMYHLNGGN